MFHTSQADALQLTRPFLPKWVMDCRVPETLEEAAFSSGAAISLLHQTLHNPALNVPKRLLRNRLALKAAMNCLKIERQSSSETDIRDGFLLSERGSFESLQQLMGPSGFMYAQWRDHVQFSLQHEAFYTNFIGTIPIHTRMAMAEITMADQPKVSPAHAATRALKEVLTVLPSEEMVAFQWADIVLSDGLGWKYMLPLVGASMTGKEVKRFASGDTKPDELLMSVHAVIARSARDAIRLCHDLARRAAKLRAVAPKLRAKGSDAAVDLFLTEDALAPSSLSSHWLFRSKVDMSPRSSLRFCERLVELGVARELSGRSTFKLYGVT